jgi:hypothetical protein
MLPRGLFLREDTSSVVFGVSLQRLKERLKRSILFCSKSFFGLVMYSFQAKNMEYKAFKRNLFVNFETLTTFFITMSGGGGALST